ncbi:MAG: hypothetical protein RR537_01390 [Longicatena sp.]
MKRFLADALLICLLVSIGSYINKADTTNTKEVLENKVSDFEEDIALKKTLKKKQESIRLNDIEDNKAAKLAKKSSEFVVGAISTSVGVCADVFAGIVK